MSHRYARHVRHDRVVCEVLTVCEVLDTPPHLASLLGGAYVVQINIGPSPGDDFIGLYDWNGDRLDDNGLVWEIADDVPAGFLAAVERVWTRDDCVLTKLP